MRHLVLVMVLAPALGCAGSQAPPARIEPAPATADATAEKLDRALARLDELVRQLTALEERLAQWEEREAEEAELGEEQREELLRAMQRQVAPPGPPAPPAPAPPPRPRPDPAVVYAVPADGHPFEGPLHARVTIVQAREFACPFSDRVRATIAQLLADYPGQLKVVYRNMVVHPQVATLPAQAACAAHEQGRYVDMANLIYDKGFQAGRDLSRAKMEALALELGLDLRRFTADMDGSCVKRVADDQAELVRFGVAATPTFFINGRHLSGARPAADFKTVIDEELARADARIKQGTRLRDYYKKWVVAKGRRSVP